MQAPSLFSGGERRNWQVPFTETYFPKILYKKLSWVKQSFTYPPYSAWGPRSTHGPDGRKTGAPDPFSARFGRGIGPDDPVYVYAHDPQAVPTMTLVMVPWLDNTTDQSSFVHLRRKGAPGSRMVLSVFLLEVEPTDPAEFSESEVARIYSDHIHLLAPLNMLNSYVLLRSVTVPEDGAGQKQYSRPVLLLKETPGPGGNKSFLYRADRLHPDARYVVDFVQHSPKKHVRGQRTIAVVSEVKMDIASKPRGTHIGRVEDDTTIGGSGLEGNALLMIEMRSSGTLYELALQLYGRLRLHHMFHKPAALTVFLAWSYLVRVAADVDVLFAVGKGGNSIKQTVTRMYDDRERMDRYRNVDRIVIRNTFLQGIWNEPRSLGQHALAIGLDPIGEMELDRWEDFRRSNIIPNDLLDVAKERRKHFIGDEIEDLEPTDLSSS